MRAWFSFSLTFVLVATLRKVVREISDSFSAPYFLASHYQTHSVRQGLRLLPRITARLNLKSPPACRVPVASNMFHPAPSCGFASSGVLADVSIVELERRLCPTCAALCGSSSELEGLMNPPSGVVVFPFLYAFFTSQLFAHSYRPVSANPHAFGWLTLAASDAARRDPALARLLEPVMEYLAPRQKAVFNRVLPMYASDDMTPSTIVAPLAHLLGSVLGLVPTSFSDGDLVVLPCGPRALAYKFSPSYNSSVRSGRLDGYHATALVPSSAMELFLRLIRTGLTPSDAALAAASLTATPLTAASLTAASLTDVATDPAPSAVEAPVFSGSSKL
jgi:hypothetical protein